MSYVDGKVVFVTGGAGGIGRATTEKLLELGAKVFVFEFSKENLEKMEGELAGKAIASFAGDVTKEEDVQAAFAKCRETLGEVDILLNNAGLGIPTPDLSAAEVAAFEKMDDVNFKGVFLCTREALKDMKARKSGHILTLISMAGQRTNPGAPIYCASKFAARGFMGGLADQVLSEGIKVTDINPGPVNSPYWGDREVPRHKFLQVEDVANVIAFVVNQPEHINVREINFDNIKYFAKG